jgi:hypothetical protein
MASTCRDVISLALRIGKVVGVSGTPTAAETELGMEALQSFYLDLVANGMFGRSTDVMTSVAYEAKPGERVQTLGGAAVSVPALVSRGCSRGKLPPYDLALIEIVDVAAGTRSLKLYEAALGAWSELSGLTLDSPAPLVSRGAMGLAATFAVSGAFLVAFGGNIDPNLAPAVKTFRLGIIGKSGSEQPRLSDGYL